MRLTHRGEYPEYWPLLSAAVKRAAGSRCIRCGHPNGDKIVYDRVGGVRLTKAVCGIAPERELARCTPHCTHPDDGKMRVLTVHHLDGDKSNDRWWNLLALCQICHLVVQAKVIPERPFLFEHTDWFKPYVAGYYAFTLRNLEMSRHQVEWAIAHWLHVGQPWLPMEVPRAVPSPRAAP